MGKSLTAREEARRRKLVAQGMSKSEVARRVGRSPGAIANWVFRRNLHTLGQSGRPSTMKGLEARAHKLYATGKNDRQISELLQVSPATIWYWRDKHRLPKNDARGIKKVAKGRMT